MSHIRSAALICIASVLVFVTPAFAADFKSNYTDVNGIRMHYASLGESDAPLVLFLHGYPAFWYQWKDQMIEVGSTHRAVAARLSENQQ